MDHYVNGSVAQVKDTQWYFQVVALHMLDLKLTQRLGMEQDSLLASLLKVNKFFQIYFLGLHA